MNTENVLRSLVLCGALTVAASPLTSFAAPPTSLIVSDDFNRGTAGAATAGTSPDLANTPGSPYSTFSYDTTQGTQPTLTSTTANTGFNGQTYLSIASSGSYTKPVQLQVSISLELNTVAADVSAFNRGVGLGFVSSPALMGGTDSGANFTGLLVNPAGALTLVHNGTTLATANPTYSGGFSASTFYNLSYSVNTSTGNITGVTYNGQDFTSTFSSASAGDFTNTATNLAGFIGSSAAYGTTGIVDNFTVSVPEPTTWLGGALLGCAGLFGGVQRLRRERQA